MATMHASACLLLCALATLVCLPSTSAVWFNLQEGRQRCFLEEIPANTLVTGTYKSMDHALLTGFNQQSGYDPNALRNAISILVTDKNNGQVISHETSPEGKFQFTSIVDGEHKVCLNTLLNTQMNRQFRFSLNLEMGDRAIDYSEIAKSEHLSAIELEIRRLIDRVGKVRQETDYQRSREEAFRNTSESTNSRVVWYNVLIGLGIILAGVAQSVLLKSFFKRKKLS